MTKLFKPEKIILSNHPTLKDAWIQERRNTPNVLIPYHIKQPYTTTEANPQKQPQTLQKPVNDWRDIVRSIINTADRMSGGTGDQGDRTIPVETGRRGGGRGGGHSSTSGSEYSDEGDPFGEFDFSKQPGESKRHYQNRINQQIDDVREAMSRSIGEQGTIIRLIEQQKQRGNSYAVDKLNKVLEDLTEITMQSGEDLNRYVPGWKAKEVHHVDEPKELTRREKRIVKDWNNWLRWGDRDVSEFNWEMRKMGHPELQKPEEQEEE